jgi:hypothetical protein
MEWAVSHCLLKFYVPEMTIYLSRHPPFSLNCNWTNDFPILRLHFPAFLTTQGRYVTKFWLMASRGKWCELLPAYSIKRERFSPTHCQGRQKMVVSHSGLCSWRQSLQRRNRAEWVPVTNTALSSLWHEKETKKFLSCLSIVILNPLLLWETYSLKCLFKEDYVFFSSPSPENKLCSSKEFS